MNLFPIWRPRMENPSRLARWVGGALALVIGLLPLAPGASARSNGELVIVALGDSLTAGYNLAPSQSFPAQLEAALKARGHRVRVLNAGVSGDTAAAGLARLDWAVPEEADAVIVELGANDALRGLDPDQTREALDHILARLKMRGVPVLLAGMRAPPNMGKEYEERFNAIYPALADKHGVLFHPFFLDGVAAVRELNLGDGVHPNTKGVAAIVAAILPAVEQLITRVTTSPAAPG